MCKLAIPVNLPASRPRPDGRRRTTARPRDAVRRRVQPPIFEEDWDALPDSMGGEVRILDPDFDGTEDDALEGVRALIRVGTARGE